MRTTCHELLAAHAVLSLWDIRDACTIAPAGGKGIPSEGDKRALACAQRSTACAELLRELECRSELRSRHLREVLRRTLLRRRWP